MAVSSNHLGMDATGDAVLFSTWHTQVSDFSTYDIAKTDPRVAAIIADITKETGSIFPKYENLQTTLRLCDQFLGGTIDTNLLAQTADRAATDLEQVTPFVKPFVPYNKGDGLGLPMAVAVFGYPVQLAEFIRNRTDATSGLVNGMSPKQRKFLRGLVSKNFTVLERCVSTGFEPA